MIDISSEKDQNTCLNKQGQRGVTFPRALFILYQPTTRDPTQAMTSA